MHWKLVEGPHVAAELEDPCVIFLSKVSYFKWFKNKALGGKINHFCTSSL